MDPFVETVRDVLGPGAKISTTITGVVKVNSTSAIDYADIKHIIGANDKRLIISRGDSAIQFHPHTGESLDARFEEASVVDSGPVQIKRFNITEFITSDDLETFFAKPMVLKILLSSSTVEVHTVKASDVVGSLAHLKRRGKVNKLGPRKRVWSEFRKKSVPRRWPFTLR